MVFSELSRLSNRDRQQIPKNPHAKPKPRRLRRAEAKQARLEAKNLETAVNQYKGTASDIKKLI